MEKDVLYYIKIGYFKENLLRQRFFTPSDTSKRFYNGKNGSGDTCPRKKKEKEETA